MLLSAVIKTTGERTSTQPNRLKRITNLKFYIMCENLLFMAK
jgi:hypothetical protein